MAIASGRECEAVDEIVLWISSCCDRLSRWLLATVMVGSNVHVYRAIGGYMELQDSC